MAIIGLLASIVLVSLNNVRAKARDTRRVADAKQINLAIQMYFDEKGSMPINRTPGVSYADFQPNFLQELVDEGLLAKNPKDIQSPTRFYQYYDYGPGTSRGALLRAINLETIRNHPDSCEVADYQYWICNPY